MDDRNNIIMGWVLGAGIVALGAYSLTSKVFHGHAPETAGYAIEGAASTGGADAGPPMEMMLASAQVTAGEAVFAKCAACHTINAGGANGIGPNLYGIMGQTIGTHAAGFAYSDALKSHGGTWDWANMNAWLTSPRRFANGTKMSFAGLSSAEDRANLMAYLNAQGSNLPLPAVPAEAVQAVAAAGVATETPPEGEAAADAPAAAPAQ